METNKLKLSIYEFSEYPGPRYINQGESSGEDFYHKKLNTLFAQAYQENLSLIVNLDGTAGYASSFLDEAFGNLVYDFSQDEVRSRVSFISKEEPDWIVMIQEEVYNDWEERRKKKQVPKKTVHHDGWFRLEDKSLNRKKWL